MKFVHSESEVEVLSDINLQLPNTGLVVLKGEKSEDKTHLLRVLAKSEDFTSGNMYVDGVDMSLLTEKEVENYRTHYAGAVTDTSELFDDLTIRENINLGMAFGRIKPAKNVMDMLYSSLKLTTCVDKRAKECSPEERVFASIARLMVKSPKVFLIDNFEDAIDPASMIKMWRLLKEVSEKHLVVIVSDSKPYIEKFADRVIEIGSGKVAKDSGVGKASSNDDKKELLDKSILVKKHRFDTSSMWTVFKQLLISNWRRVTMTLVTCMLLIVGFFITGSLCVFDANATIAKSSKQHNEAYIQFYKDDDGDRATLNYDTTVGETVIAALQRENLAYFCAMHEVGWRTNINDGYSVSALITNSQTLAVGDENKFGQELLSGKYTGSAAISNAEENGTDVVISDYLAEVIIRRGINSGFAPGQNIEGGLRNMALYDALTNQTGYRSVNFQMNGMDYNIVGIYKTDFDQYVDKDLQPLKGKKDIFEYNLANIYTVVHVNTNFYTLNARRAATTSIAATDMSVYAAVGETYTPLFDDGRLNIVNGASGYYYNSIYPLISDAKFTELGETSYNIYVSADIYYALCQHAGSNATYEEIVTDYANYDDMIANTKYRSIQIAGRTNRYTIVGVIPGGGITNTIVMSGKKVSSANMGERSQFEYMYLSSSIDTNAVVMPASIFNASEIENTIGVMASLGYNVSSLASEAISGISKTISDLRIVLIIVALALAAVVVMIIISFARKMITANPKTIGLLRSLGCTKVNVNFILVMFIILGIVASILVAILLSWLFTLIGNAIMAGSYGYAVSIFGINFWILMVFVILILIGVAILIPNICEDYHNATPAALLAHAMSVEGTPDAEAEERKAEEKAAKKALKKSKKKESKVTEEEK